jgi:hypothetical protein
MHRGRGSMNQSLACEGYSYQLKERRQDMLKQRLFVLFGVLMLLLMPSALADEDEEGDDDEKILGMDAEDLGEVALYFLVATLSIAVWKPSFKWLRKNGPDLFNTEPRAFKKKLGVFNRRFMKVHNWLGVIAAVVGTAHGIVLEWHWTLWAGMAGIWILIFSGSLMQWKWPPKEFRKGARILHMQRVMSIVAIVLLYVGHGIVD